MSLHDKREDNNKLLQFKPARAKKSVKFDDLAEDHVKDHVTEQKLDGQRFIVQTDRPTIDHRFQHGLTSRRESKITGRFVEKTDRVPHIANAKGLPYRSMLDCELVAPTDQILVELPGVYWDHMLDPTHRHSQWLLKKYQGAIPVYPHVAETTSIMGSSAEEAVRKQEERGNIQAWCFDILAIADKLVTNNKYALRRALLAKSLESVDPESGIVMMPAFNLPFKGVQGLYERITSARGEGLMLKALNLPYDHARHWIKVKALFYFDAVLTGGFTWGKEGVSGKMLGLAGNLEIGVYLNGCLVPIGYVSAVMDSEANLPRITEMCEDGSIAGQVIEVAYNDLQKDPTSLTGYSLRHPRSKRWRDDKSPEDCTLDALLELFNAKSE